MTKTVSSISTENLILIDWLTFTSHCDSPETLMIMLGLKDVAWQRMDKGRNGYRQRWFFENISILFDGADNMGVCVDMSGTGCRVFETYSIISWQELIEILYFSSEDYNVTRLDMAFDDHTGILDMDVLQDDTDDHMYVSRSRQWKVEYMTSARGSGQLYSIPLLRLNLSRPPPHKNRLPPLRLPTWRKSFPLRIFLRYSMK